MAFDRISGARDLEQAKGDTFRCYVYDFVLRVLEHMILVVMQTLLQYIYLFCDNLCCMGAKNT